MILTLIGYASLGHIVVDFISTLDEKDLIPNKPFKCDMCFTYWYSVIPLVYEFGLKGFIYAGIAGIISDLIYRIKNKI